MGRLLLALGLTTLAFDLATVALKSRLGSSHLTLGDLSEAAGVFVIAALYARIATEAVAWRGDAPPRPLARTAPARTALLLAIALYALGRGVHLASNSISDALVLSSLSDPGGVVYFWDERFSHIAVDAARIALAVVLTHIERAGETVERVGGGLKPSAAVGGAAYGFIYFGSAVEGQTVPLALPFCVLYATWSFATRSRAGAIQRFFTVAFVVSLLFFAAWFLWQGGFPEFTRTGILPTPDPGR